LVKPDGTDLVDIAVINSNYDKIDANIASTKIQATKPATANAGDLWWDSNTGTLYLYYTDANSSQWVAATSDPVNIGVVANQSDRDAQYPTPGQGMKVYRTDLGVTQTYYGLFNASTNPGGRDVAGWYDTEKSVGLVPVQPTVVTVTGGSAVTNSLGEVTFTGSTTIALDGVFSNNFRNYKVLVTVKSAVSGADFGFRVIQGGVVQTNPNWYGAGFYVPSAGTSLTPFANNGQNYGRIASGVGSNEGLSAQADIYQPFTTERTWVTSHAASGGVTVMQAMGMQWASFSQVQGIALFNNGGASTGTIQVFGYSD
jgi:hypothetical protein